MNRAQKITLIAGVVLLTLVTSAIPSGNVSVMNLVVALFALTALLYLYAVSLIWVYRDARERNKPASLVTFWVAVLWPVGLLFWVVFRPERVKRSRKRVHRRHPESAFRTSAEYSQAVAKP